MNYPGLKSEVSKTKDKMDPGSEAGMTKQQDTKAVIPVKTGIHFTPD